MERQCKVLKQEYRLLGYISDEQILGEVYNIADFMSPHPYRNPLDLLFVKQWPVELRSQHSR